MPANPVLVKYYIYDPNAKDELGGHRVETEDVTGNKYVMMNSDQATYWESMLAIGRKTFDQLDATRQKNLNQMFGGKLLAVEGTVMSQQQHGGGPEAFAAQQQSAGPQAAPQVQKRSVKRAPPPPPEA
jgi:hypothetical protein